MDISPEPDGTEESPYYETIIFEAAGDVSNAESQNLAIVRYHQVVRRKSNDQVFHDQIGYWTWDARDAVIAQSIVIPRAVGVLAGGSHSGAASGTKVELARDNARTVAFEHRITVDGDSMKYAEKTSLEIYGRRFDHTDENESTRS